MTDHIVRTVNDNDLKYLANNLRKHDLLELRAVHGDYCSLTALSSSSRRSTVCSIDVVNDKPMVISGMFVIGNAAAIWAVATPEINRNKILFLKQARERIQRWFDIYPAIDYMYNFTHADNTVHHNWLQWCGAELKPPVTYGALGEKFLPFIIQRKNI